MRRSTLALRRFGVAALVIGTVAAGAPALVGASPARAQSIDDVRDLLDPDASPSATPAGTAMTSPSASASRSASASATATPSASAPATVSPGASGSPSPSASSTASISPSASASASTAASPSGCVRAAEVTLGRTPLTATGSAPVSVTASPGSLVELFAYSRPSTDYRLVRSGTTDANGSITFADLRPPTNTRLYAQQRGCASGPQTVLNVRTQLSLDVVRNGQRSYTFSGRALPARNGGLIVSLYRVTNDGRQVLTSQTRASASTGRYVINRRFTGTGRFGFVVRTGQDLQNAPGSSNVRSLLVF